MTGQNALKACARGLLAAEYDATGEVFDERKADRIRAGMSETLIDFDMAVAAIEKALTRSPVREDARGELVEAAQGINEALIQSAAALAAMGAEHLATELLKLVKEIEPHIDALSKSLPSLLESGEGP